MEEEEVCVGFVLVNAARTPTCLQAQMLASISVFGRAVARTSARACAHTSALARAKRDLMQHGIPDTSGALSIFFFFGKDFLLSGAVPSICDIYEAPMSPGACCPDN